MLDNVPQHLDYEIAEQQKLFVSSKKHNNDSGKEKKKAKRKKGHNREVIKKCHSLPCLLDQNQYEFDDHCGRTELNMEKHGADEGPRGYFYESVGGVYYTLQWPLVINDSKEADSGTHSLAPEKAEETTTSKPAAEELNMRSRAPPLGEIGRQPRIHPRHNPLATVRFRAYYLEGGWGVVVIICAILAAAINQGLLLSVSVVAAAADKRFRVLQPPLGVPTGGWLGAMSTSVSLLISPIIIGFCRRKSTRLTAVMGGLVTALGCLFTSFASQFHQLFFSYGTMIGVGVAMTRDPATLMVGQYFKRRRELVEIFLVSGSGLGIATMSIFIKVAISSIGWRLGLQAVTGVVFLTFVLGTFYRSASLYHPQRRAILHLKSQKRKIKSKDKEKNKVQDDTPPFFDFTTLKSRTVQILLLSVGVGSFGLNTPIFYLAQQALQEGIRGRTLLWLQAYLGIAWTLGCVLFGCVVVNNSTECRISKQYLCQAALFMAGVSILAFTAVEGYNGYVVFVWIYGIFNGGYNYALKMYIYEKVRARNFARAWGFAQCSMAIPNALGVPVLGYINSSAGGRSGYYFSAAFVILGSLVMVLIDVHRKNLRRKKQNRQSKKLLTERISLAPDGSVVLHGPIEESPAHEPERRHSFSDQDDILPPVSLLSHQRSFVYDDVIDLKKPELTIYSEEGIADMDLPDNILFEDLDYLDNITSCNKVENCLMLSEYEQNLIKETEDPTTSTQRKARKWSLFRQPTLQTINSESEDISVTIGVGGVDTRTNTKGSSTDSDPTPNNNLREIPKFPNTAWRLRHGPNTGPKRAMTVIDEASV